MRYWDASALVPLLIEEEATPIVRGWLAEDSRVVTWCWSRVEIVSAIERRVREGSVSRRQRRTALECLEVLSGAWDEVTEVLAVRSRAGSLLARHPLRAADAGQLGAALLLGEQLAGPLEFVSLDRRLATAAEREGLRLPRPVP